MVPVGVLDHILVQRGSSARQALAETFELAYQAETLGFKRFWIGEQHLERSGCGTPETLIPILLEKTQTIRVGSGGIMLNHVNPYRIAKSAQVLTRIYGNRLDLGFGRANGADGAELEGLNFGKLNLSFEEKFSELLRYFICDDRKLFKDSSSPEIFMLSSSADMIKLSKKHGISLAVPHFLNPTASIQALESFQNSSTEHSGTTKSIMAIQVIIDIDQKPLKKRCLNYLRYMQDLKQDPRSFLPRMDDQPNLSNMDTDDLKAFFQGPTLIGTKETIKNRIQNIMVKAWPDEIIFVPYGPSMENKLKSLEIIAEIAHELPSIHNPSQDVIEA